MINLLPSDFGARLRLAHQSSVLRRWLAAALAASIGLALVMAFGWIYIERQSKNLSDDLSSLQAQLAGQDLAGTQKKAKDITNNIKTINQVLSREIRFSGLMNQIGSVMPPGAVLASLTLSKIDGAIDLSTTSRDYPSAAQIAVNLSDPKSEIFDKVDIVSITCSAASSSVYPCNGTFRALFNKTAQSKFLNVPKGTQ